MVVFHSFFVRLPEGNCLSILIIIDERTSWYIHNGNESPLVSPFTSPLWVYTVYTAYSLGWAVGCFAGNRNLRIYHRWSVNPNPNVWKKSPSCMSNCFKVDQQFPLFPQKNHDFPPWFRRSKVCLSPSRTVFRRSRPLLLQGLRALPSPRLWRWRWRHRPVLPDGGTTAAIWRDVEGDDRPSVSWWSWRWVTHGYTLWVDIDVEININVEIKPMKIMRVCRLHKIVGPTRAMKILRWLV